MNNEPVAWMRENEVWEGKYNFSKEKPPAYPNAIPLYTHPAELTDEEIRKFMAEMPHLTERKDLLMFARAILRKAQEK